MSLEENMVPVIARFTAAAQEVIERDLVQRCRRSKCRQVTTDALEVFVRFNNHRHRVPANDTFQASLKFAVTWKCDLVINVDRVDVGRVGTGWQFNAFVPRFGFKDRQQVFRSLVTLAVDYIFQRVDPFLGCLLYTSPSPRDS